MLTAIIACWRWMHYIVGIPTVWELNDGEHDGKQAKENTILVIYRKSW